MQYQEIMETTTATNSKQTTITTENATMTTRSFSGCTFTRTQTTTGEDYKCVWSISGRLSKPAMKQPFLTSFTACREYVRDHDRSASGAVSIYEDGTACPDCCGLPSMQRKCSRCNDLGM
jgi:hypothetical protein